MMLNLGGNASVVVWVPRRPPTTIMCFAQPSGFNAEQLRIQLDRLHTEAENTRAKANNARLRLMRLSEAAEKLRRQAVVSVQSGKENDARELLLQKKKVLQAMAKSKNRIELLDQLLMKLSEGISVRETQLIGNVASDIDVDRADASVSVRIVPPKKEASETLGENENFDFDSSEHDCDKNLQINAKPPKASNLEVLDHSKDSLIGTILEGAGSVASLKEISSFDEFLSHLDQQLNKIEVELVTVLRFSTLVLEEKEKLENAKMRQTEEILDSIFQIRERIARMMQKVENK